MEECAGVSMTSGTATDADAISSMGRNGISSVVTGKSWIGVEWIFFCWSSKDI